ncbi:laminin G domain-containing protein [Actinoplanes sp. NPDC020271]|uniref:laminin G domain-containing protein n=1 Tax=Actinoplanes sp. NPDC020271 TaxID=3363896 RepID=UPI00378CE2F8
MRRWFPLLATTILLTGTPMPAHASAVATIAYWGMDEPYGATRMSDSSGNRLDGQIGGEVGTGTAVRGATGYRFDRLEPDTPPAHPGHLVVVPDDPAMNPGARDFAVTLRLRTTGHFGNIIQKGQSATEGGNFKLQIPNGKVQCSFRGDRGVLEADAPYAINDGAWHVVTCVRVSTGVALAIDGQRVAGRQGWTGAIRNNWPLTIGGKLDCDQRTVGCDYYAGDLDYVSLATA